MLHRAVLAVCVLWSLAGLGQAQEAAAGTAGEWVTLTTAYGTHFDAYAAGPEDAAVGVLLLHDRLGFNRELITWADRLAAQGYRALAIDLYDGRRARSWQHATSIMNAIDHVWAESDIAAAIKALQAPGRKLALLGWDWGAEQALTATLADSAAVAAAVLYYPTAVETDINKVQGLATPVLLLVAEQDPRLSVSAVTAFRDGLTKTRVEFTIMGLDADRGFANALSPHYDDNAAAVAWETAQDFLTTYLSP